MTIDDDETAALLLSRSAALALREGETATYTVRLGAPPAAGNVEVRVSSDDAAVTVNKAGGDGRGGADPDLRRVDLEHGADGDGRGGARRERGARDGDADARGGGGEQRGRIRRRGGGDVECGGDGRRGGGDRGQPGHGGAGADGNGRHEQRDLYRAAVGGSERGGDGAGVERRLRGGDGERGGFVGPELQHDELVDGAGGDGDGGDGRGCDARAGDGASCGLRGVRPNTSPRAR